MSTLQGELTITTNLAGCAVLLNNVPKGTTDASGFLSVRSLKPGQYVVVARKLGYRDETRTINVSAGRSELVPVTLSPLPGGIIVRPNVAGARIEIRGVGVFADSATVAQVAPGTYQVSVSKPGFRTVEQAVEVKPGAPATLSVALSPVTPAEMLAQAERDFGRQRFAAVIATCHSLLPLLTAQPDQALANQLLGMSLYHTGSFAESVAPLVKALKLGREVVLPIKHHHRGGSIWDDALCEGSLKLRSDSLTFESLNVGGHDFTAPYQKLQEIKPENFKGGRLNVKVGLPKGNREERKDYNFHVAQTQLINTGDPGKAAILKAVCREAGCDAAVQMLYQLLLRMKQP